MHHYCCCCIPAYHTRMVWPYLKRYWTLGKIKLPRRRVSWSCHPLFCRIITLNLIRSAIFKNKGQPLELRWRHHMPFCLWNRIGFSRLCCGEPFTRWRYIDDIFLVWDHGEQALTDFIEKLNTFHPTIMLTAE